MLEIVSTINIPEQRIVLHDVSWQAYERLLEDFTDRSVPHFTYDRGTLEIMSPTQKHEKLNRAINLLVEIVAEELGIDVENYGSTTFKRRDLKRGFEPDTCFYIQSLAQVEGKTKIDLSIDPPPDLVIEIDVTSPSVDKFPIYAAVGVPEIWLCKDAEVIIYQLVGKSYERRERSLALPLLTDADLTAFVAQSATLKRTAWLRELRKWMRARK